MNKEEKKAIHYLSNWGYGKGSNFNTGNYFINKRKWYKYWHWWLVIIVCVGYSIALIYLLIQLQTAKICY